MEGIWAFEEQTHDVVPTELPRFTSWTDERIALLKKLWCQDKSAGQIAKQLGISRGAVMGKLNRLHLLGSGKKSKLTPEGEETLKQLWTNGVSQRVISKQLGVSRTCIYLKASKLGLPPRRELSRITRPANPTQKRKRFSFVRLFGEVPVIPVEIPATQRKSLLDLEPHHCRWPFGDPGDSDFGFCGADKASGFSYCPGHVRASMGRGA
jgi:GcrA cell cycle regulator